MTLILLGVALVAAGLAVTNERDTIRDEFWFISETIAASLAWIAFCLVGLP